MLDQAPTAAVVGSFSESDILSFYLSLTIPVRRARFKAHADDGYIRRWRSAIDRQHYWVAGIRSDGRPIALVELFGSPRSRWRRPELAISLSPVFGLPFLVVEDLMNVGVEEARSRRAADLVLWLDNEDRIASLARLRGAWIDTDLCAAVIPLADL